MTKTAADHPPIEETVTIAGNSLSILRPPSAEDLIDEDAYERDERLPYWAELWPSGLVLADHISGHDLRNQRILELGCGLGLPSLIAAYCGASVVATDWYSESLEFAERNARTADLEIQTALIDWFHPSEGSLPERAFDLILGADLLYEERNGTALAMLIPPLLASGGEVVIADPRRPHADALLGPLAEAGWRLETTEVRHQGRQDESGPIVKLHRLRPGL